MGIVRKSQKVLAFNFDPKGVKMGAPSDPGPDPDRVKCLEFPPKCSQILLVRVQLFAGMLPTLEKIAPWLYVMEINK